MITLKGLAEKLNVSISTVSKALNDSSEISEKTVIRVKELAKMYNYKPNKVALSLKNSQTKTIGVIIPNILNHFFAKVLYGIEKESAKKGYSIITCLSNESYDKEFDSLQLLANGSVDGFIMSIAEETQREKKTDHFDSILTQKIPIVMFDRVADEVECDKVVIDDFDAAYKATKHLINEGRKRIMLVNCLDELSVGKLRAKGCLQAINETETFSNALIELKINNSDDIEKEIEAVMKKYNDLDGIISIDNISGVVAINSAKKYKFSIPKDLSIIGFSDDNVLHYSTPKLSTVTQHSDDIGAKAVQLLIKRIETKEYLKNETKTVNYSINLRGTTL